MFKASRFVTFKDEHSFLSTRFSLYIFFFLQSSCNNTGNQCRYGAVQPGFTDRVQADHDSRCATGRPGRQCRSEQVNSLPGLFIFKQKKYKYRLFSSGKKKDGRV